MSKAIRFLLEVNDASFAWYCTAAAFLYGMEWTYPALMRESGVSLKAVAWFMGMSAALKIWAYAIREKEADGAIRGAIAKLRPSAASIAGSTVILWALFAYRANGDMYRMLAGSGVPAGYATAIFFVLYWCVIMGAIRDENDGTKEKEVHDGTIKEIYRKRRERQGDTRCSDEFPLRKYAHETEYGRIASFIRKGESVLDAGCGDGTLAVMLARKGARVTACDISEENVAACRRKARDLSVAANMAFVEGDAEALPFGDGSFDWVVSSHVLEHLPDFEKGLAELRRVTKKRAIIAMPTCLNPCAAVILGGDAFWTLSRWSLTAWFVGCIRIILNLGGEGVNEGYAGDARLPHIWRYPWVMRRKLEEAGFRIVSFQASSLCLPYFKTLLPLAKKMEKYRTAPVMKNFGYGSIATVEK